MYDHKEEVDLSIKYFKLVKYLKFILAILIVGSYFYNPQYLTELIVIGLVLSLLLPQGFMDTYLEKLIGLRMAETDERQLLNASEANKHFESVFERMDELESKVQENEMSQKW